MQSFKEKSHIQICDLQMCASDQMVTKTSNQFIKNYMYTNFTVAW